MDANDASPVMRHEPPRRTRAHLDDLIEGRRTTPDPVAGLLAAASAPALAQPDELAGLDSTVAAFAAAPTGVVPNEEKIPMLHSAARRLLPLKVLALAAGVAATGGVAFAAVSNNHAAPNAHHSAVGETSGAPSSGAAGSGSLSMSESASSSAAASSSAPGSESRRPNHSATPSPSLVGLCTAWLAHPRDVAKVPGNPAFSVLIKAAGGADAVNGYCTTLLASAHPTHRVHPVHPSQPVHPTQAQNTKSHPGSSSHPSHPAHPTRAHNTKHPKPTSTPTS